MNLEITKLISYSNLLNSPTNTSFPEKKDECWIPEDDILCMMSSPTIIPGINIAYSFEKRDVKNVNCLMKLKIKNS